MTNPNTSVSDSDSLNNQNAVAQNPTATKKIGQPPVWLIVICIVALVAVSLAVGYAMGTNNKTETGSNLQATQEECNSENDCTTAPVEHCNCNNGGAVIALPKASLSAYMSEPAHAPAFCLAVISNDPSCAKTVKCENHKCVLVP